MIQTPPLCGWWAQALRMVGASFADGGRKLCAPTDFAPVPMVGASFAPLQTPHLLTGLRTLNNHLQYSTLGFGIDTNYPHVFPWIFT